MSYTLKEIVGRGSFGTTFKAFNSNNEVVAIKAIDIGASEAAGAPLRNIAQEAAILKKLSDTGGCGTYVTCYYDGFIANYLGRPHAILVSEFVDGPSLRKFIEQGVRLPRVMWSVMTQLVLGLRSIHERGFAHRDIKPENILITNDNKIKYIDFGISCLQKCNRTMCVDNCKTGPATILYAPPELLAGKMEENFNAAKVGDIWSLAMVFFELANGSFNFPFITQENGKSVSESQLKRNIINAPQLSSNYRLDDGQTNEFLGAVIINDWNSRPTIEQVINMFMEIIVVPLR